MDAEEIKPIIAPLFSSGSASTREALKTELPAVFINAPKKAKIHSTANSCARYPTTKNASDETKLIAMIQNLALGDSFIIPSRITDIRDAAVQIDKRYPYCSTLKPFSTVKGSISEKAPADKRFKISTNGTNNFRQGSEKISFTAVFVS